MIIRKNGYTKWLSLNCGFTSFFSLIAITLLVTMNGCQKEDQSLGIDLLPGVTVIKTRTYQDLSSISAYTFLDDNFLLVDTSTVSSPRYFLLGSFNDPLFGNTRASYGAQFRMPRNPKFNRKPQDGGDAVLDSVILQMSYNYTYGDTITGQNIIVRELADGLQYGSGYASTYKIKDHVLAQNLGSLTHVPKFRTNETRTDTTRQILRIPLNPELGNRLLRMDTLNYETNEKFLSVFKGLYVETAPLARRGSLMRIDAPSHFLVVYYHNAKNDSLAFAFNVSENSAGVPGYDHDYTATPFFANLNQQTGNDTLVYLQPSGGTKVRINIPNLSTWKDSTNYAINKASLTIHVDTLMSDYRRFEMPPQLFLKVINDEGKEVFPKDAELSASYYGGFYNRVNGTYVFNITQHLQQVIQGTNNNGFLLVAAERNTSPKRVILKSGSSSKPLELNVVYTRYK